MFMDIRVLFYIHLQKNKSRVFEMIYSCFKQRRNYGEYGKKCTTTRSGACRLGKNVFHAVIDSKKKLINIDARWPGATHDSRIFNNSQLKTVLETGKYKVCSIPTSAL